MKQFLLLFLLLNFKNGHTQIKVTENNLQSSSTIHFEKFYGIDIYGNLYGLVDNEFIKKSNQSEFKYRNVALGKIESVDLQNPLQIVLFYKEMNAAVLLDNQLNETAVFNFSELDPDIIPSQLGLASQNRFWLFDLASNRLGLFDFRSKKFSPISNPITKTLLYSQSDYNYFYWIDRDYSIYACNLFGKINFLGKIEPFDEIQIASEKNVLFRKKDQLFNYDLETEKSEIFELPEKSIAGFCFKEQILAIFTRNEIRNYKILLP